MLPFCLESLPVIDGKAIVFGDVRVSNNNYLPEFIDCRQEITDDCIVLMTAG